MPEGWESVPAQELKVGDLVSVRGVRWYLTEVKMLSPGLVALGGRPTYGRHHVATGKLVWRKIT
jgi:hypothetical protein